jgi:hypothetical protein
MDAAPKKTVTLPEVLTLFGRVAVIVDELTTANDAVTPLICTLVTPTNPEPLIVIVAPDCAQVEAGDKLVMDGGQLIVKLNVEPVENSGSAMI